MKKKIKNFLIVLFISFVSLPGFAQENASSIFRAAVVKIDITPENPQWLRGYNPRLSTGIHDRLFHRIVALDDGKTQFFLVSSDLVGFPPAEYHKVTALLQSKYGIDPLNVWWSTTHTHSAPEVAAQFKGVPFPSMANRSKLSASHEIDTLYTTMLEQKLIEGIAEARKNLAPARLGVGWGFSQANINRRAIDVDGKASLGLNPDGAVDRQIGLIRIDKEDGSPMALIANYAIHGTVLGGQSTEISGDVPGIVADYVEQKIGAPVLFINGAAGNLAPIYSVYSNPQTGHLGQFRVLLGDRILEANRMISTTTESVSLFAGALTVETPRREGLDWSPDLKEYSRKLDSGIHMVRLPVRFLRINEDIGIWSAPIELFCEVSNAIRQAAPFPYTFYYGYTNGSLGYLPSAAAWENEGYEPSVSPFTPAAEKDLIESVLGYFNGEMRGISY